MVSTSLGSLLGPLLYFLDNVSYPQSVQPDGTPLNLATLTLTLPFVVVADSRRCEPDPEPVEVLRGGQELREQGHLEDTPARARPEPVQSMEGGQ